MFAINHATQDVQQVHLNFERIFRAEEEEGELRDDLVEGMQCGMPSFLEFICSFFKVAEQMDLS